MNLTAVMLLTVALQGSPGEPKPADRTVECGAGRGGLRVAVVDEEGAVVQDAHVSLVRHRGVAAHQATDRHGQSHVEPLSFPGPYTLRVEAVGFSVSVVEDVWLRDGCEVRLRVPIQVNLENSVCVLTVPDSDRE